jgi:hypothetical protein
VLEFLTDPQFLSAVAAAIGPLAFFAAPTEEIEALLHDDDSTDMSDEDFAAEASPETSGFPEAA